MKQNQWGIVYMTHPEGCTLCKMAAHRACRGAKYAGDKGYAINPGGHRAEVVKILRTLFGAVDA